MVFGERSGWRERHLPGGLETWQGKLKPWLKQLDPAKLENRLDKLEDRFDPLQEHIRATWPDLKRVHSSWFLNVIQDEKIEHVDGEPYYLYIAPTESQEAIEATVRNIRDRLVHGIQKGNYPIKKDAEGKVVRIRDESELPEIKVRTLNKKMIDGKEYLIPWEKDGKYEHGLLYLPYSYIVPGERFNEMYGWDSAFTIRGLRRDDEFDRAKPILENLLYQIEHYGTVLNGNRTYFLNDEGPPRSQPPLITDSIQSIYNHYDDISGVILKGEDRHSGGRLKFLERAIKTVEKYHGFWMTGAHYDEGTGLSIYNTVRTKPSDEVAFSEKAHHEEDHYQVAARQLGDAYKRIVKTLHHKGIHKGIHKGLSELTPEDTKDLPYQDRKDLYYAEQYLEFEDPEKKKLKENEHGKPMLSETFYQGDWAMRESGIDPSRRFGFFNTDIINHIPYCLNSLRYKMEKEIAGLCGTLAEDQYTDWERKKAKWEKVAPEVTRLYETLAEGNTLNSLNDWQRKRDNWNAIAEEMSALYDRIREHPAFSHPAPWQHERDQWDVAVKEVSGLYELLAKGNNPNSLNDWSRKKANWEIACTGMNKLVELYQSSMATPAKERWEGKQKEWTEKAKATKAAMDEFLWDNGIEDEKQVREPCFRDRNINERLRKKYHVPLFRDYNYASIFFTMFAKVADDWQAAHIMRNVYPKLISRYGLRTSTRHTGSQWDGDFTWAPFQVIAMAGCENYGYFREAAQIGGGFISTVIRNFQKTGKIFEKYIHGSSETERHVDKGYSVNDKGFAWTNSGSLEIIHSLRRLLLYRIPEQAKQQEAMAR